MKPEYNTGGIETKNTPQRPHCSFISIAQFQINTILSTVNSIILRNKLLAYLAYFS